MVDKINSEQLVFDEIESIQKKLNESARDCERNLIREWLTSTELHPVESQDKAQATTLFRIEEIKIYEHLSPGEIHNAIQGTMRKLLTSLRDSRSTVVFLLLGDESKVQIFVGIQPAIKSGEHFDGNLRASLEGLFPGIRLKKLDPQEVANVAKEIGDAGNCSLLTGVPLVYHQGERQTYCAEVLARGMYGRRFGYLVLAEPVDDDKITKLKDRLLSTIQDFQEQAKATITKTLQVKDGQSSSLAKSVNASAFLAQTFSQQGGVNVSFTTGVTFPFASTVTVGASGGLGWASTIGGSLGAGVTHSAGVANGGSSFSISSERVNRFAESYRERLEILLLRLALAQSEGWWHTSAYMFAKDYSILSQVETLFLGAYSSDFGQFEPFHRHRIPKASEAASRFSLPTNFSSTNDQMVSELYQYDYATPLLSSELSVLFNLPGEDLPGYRVRRVPKFSVNPSPVDAHPIPLGSVCDRERLLPELTFEIGKDELCRHALITGITGSGKTNTVFSILTKLGDTPFLVIEPSKNEYRELRKHPSIREKLKVYTTYGSDNPFYMNPFEIGEGENLQTHLEALKAILNASFPMWGPLPSIVETCLYETYEKRGWDVASSTHRRGSKAFPTLKDFAEEVDEYVKSSNYSKEVKDNINASLNMRLKTLLSGSKGRMLNVDRSSPTIAQLLERPTVLELKTLGDDDDKILVMGILLLRIYQYTQRENFANNAFSNDALKHLLIVEEAHRLFRKTVWANGAEVANTRAKGVEYFENIISEIRAYGVGIVIVDQIPSRIAEGAIKNTNLKIAHRLTSADDMECIGRACNMAPTECSYMASQQIGYALAYGSTMDRPVSIKVDNCKSLCRQPAKPSSDENVGEGMGNISVVQCEKSSIQTVQVDRVFEKLRDFIRPVADMHLRALWFSRVDDVRDSNQRAQKKIANIITRKGLQGSTHQDEGGKLLADLLKIGVDELIGMKFYLKKRKDSTLIIRSHWHDYCDSHLNDENVLKQIQSEVANIGNCYREEMGAAFGCLTEKFQTEIDPFLPESLAFKKILTDVSLTTDAGSLLSEAREEVKKSFLIEKFDLDTLNRFALALVICSLRGTPQDVSEKVARSVMQEILRTEEI